MRIPRQATATSATASFDFIQRKWLSIAAAAAVVPHFPYFPVLPVPQFVFFSFGKLCDFEFTLQASKQAKFVDVALLGQYAQAKHAGRRSVHVHGKVSECGVRL